MTNPYDLRALSPDALLAGLGRLVRRDCQTTAELLAHLAEVDARRLYLDQACASMFTYCVERLRMSEPTAFARIEAARAARRFPVIFEHVADGRLHLSGVRLLAPRLRDENHRELLEAACHRSKRDIERLLAARFPGPEVAPSLRKVPAPRQGAASPAAGTAPVPTVTAAPTTGAASETPRLATASSPAIVAPPSATPPPGPPPPVPLSLTPPPPPPARTELRPLSADRYILRVTLSAGTLDKLRAAQALLRHRNPDGDLDAVLGHALDALLRDLRRDRFGQTASPRAAKAPAAPTGRHVPNADRRAVIARDGEQCSFVDAQGRRCQERGWLEIDHLVPVGKGGTAANGTRILCRAHNRHAAEREFGEAWVRQRIAAARAAPDERAPPGWSRGEAATPSPPQRR